jgi:hypothetical protein
MSLPRSRLVPALLGFNVGVELGQLAIVATGWLVLVTLERRIPGARRRVAEIGSAAICGLARFWFVTRAGADAGGAGGRRGRGARRLCGARTAGR